MTAELVLDARAALGEGPIWDPRRGRLVFVDIHRQQIHEFDPATGTDRVMDVDRPVSAIGLSSGPHWIAAAGLGFVRVDPDRGDLELLVDVEPAGSRRRMNDGAVDPAGRFWAGSMSLDGVAGQGRLYRLDGALHAEPMVAPVTTSNGPAWSPDGRLMYYVDTRTRRIDVFDFDIATGAIENRRTFVDGDAGPGRPDGVIVDCDGGVWVALWQGWAIRRYGPDGTLDREVGLPTRCPTKCAFGGTDLSDLYVTTARAPVDAVALAGEPAAGGLFRLRPGVRGLPAVPFR